MRNPDGLINLALFFYPSFNEKLMKTNLYVENHFPVGKIVMKLALVSGALLSCMYGVLLIFATAFKFLG